MPTNLPENIKKTAAFFTPENLASLTLKYKDQLALLVIDVQEDFCNPNVPFGGDGWSGDEARGNEETKAVSERIQSVVPEFRKANIPVYDIYYSAYGGALDLLSIDFYKFTPAPTDTLVPKSGNSAFADGNIKDILEKDHRKLLLTCGFNQAACVRDTVLDARKAGYEVCLLQDLAGNDNFGMGSRDDATRRMKEAGVIMTTSDEVLKLLRAPQP